LRLARTLLVTAIVGFLMAFLLYPLAHSCKGAFFDGSWRVLATDLRNWQALCSAVSEAGGETPASVIRQALTADVQEAVSDAAESGTPAPEVRKALLERLNGLIGSGDLAQQEAFFSLVDSPQGRQATGIKHDYARRHVKKRSRQLAAGELQQLMQHDPAWFLAAVQKAEPDLADKLRMLTEDRWDWRELQKPVGRTLAPQLLDALDANGLPGLQAALEARGLASIISISLPARHQERANRLLVEAAFPDAIRPMTFKAGHFTLGFFKYFWTDALTRACILNSLALGCVVTVLTAALALPLSLAVVRYRFPGKTLLTGLLLLPMIMPPFVGAIGMRQVLARFGSLNLLMMRLGMVSSPIDWLGGAKFWGVVILEVLHLYPIMYLNFAAALANVDPSLEEAAMNLGSHGPRLFRRITLPLMMPGVFAGSVLVFIWAFTDLGTPLVFGYRQVVAVQIFNQVSDLESNPQGYALVVGVLAITALIFLLTKRLFGLRSYQSLTRGPSAGGEKKAGALRSALIVAFLLAVVGAACLPHAAVILSSLKGDWFMSVLPGRYTLEHFHDALGHPLTLSSIRNSIAYSSLSTVLDVILGVLIAYLLVRHTFWGSHVLDALVMLPLAVPGLVLAFGYVAAFSGTALDPRENPVALLVIAYAIRRLPYMVRAAYAGFQQINVQLEEAAVNLGSPPLRAVRRITVPLLSANLIAGGVLVFSFAMLEVSDSLILAMKEQFYPITKAIFVLVQRIEDGPYIASALGVWAMVFLGLSLITAGALLGRRMGQLFRV